MSIEIIITFDNDMSIEYNPDGWEDHYRLVGNDGAATYWGKYEHLFYLNGIVAVSPYYNDNDNWVLLTPEEAIKMTAVGLNSEF